PQGLGLHNRGIGLWSFPTADLELVRERALRHGAPVLRETVLIESPGLGAVSSMILATPDGFPLEVYQPI
ncbi:MAG: VOC family protein, partial [Gammaproteobacteria bacterium]